MEIKIKTTGAFILNEELRTYIDKKISKLEVFLQNDPTALAQIEVGTTSAGQRTGDVYRGEVHVTFMGGNVYTEAVEGSAHAALDEAFSEAQRKMRTHMGKNRDLFKRGTAQVKDFFRNFGK